MNPIDNIVADFESMTNEEYAKLLKEANERTHALEKSVKIVALEFIFENCESAVVDAKNVDCIKISQISHSIHIQGSSVYEDKFSDYTIINLIDYENLDYDTCIKTKENLLKRLQQKDVTGIVLHLNNGIKSTFYLPFGENDYTSEHMLITEKKWHTEEKYLKIIFDKSIKY